MPVEAAISGPDHPHKEMYETSLHGTIYKMTQNPDRAPRCVTCHMPNGTHNSSFGIARGPAGTRSEVVDLKEVPISKEEEERRREEMLGVCTGCHSRRFAQEQLENADQVKEAGFKLQEKGKEADPGDRKRRVDLSFCCGKNASSYRRQNTGPC